MPSHYIYGFLVVLVILYIGCTWNTRAYEDYLYGFWTAADDEFCDNSEIDHMMLFFGKSEGCFTKSRTGYLVIMPDMFNGAFTIEYKTGWSGMSVVDGSYTITAAATFEDEQLWPETITITIDILHGTMMIRGCNGDDDQVYAMLQKQHDITNVAINMNDAELVD